MHVFKCTLDNKLKIFQHSINTEDIVERGTKMEVYLIFVEIMK